MNECDRHDVTRRWFKSCSSSVPLYLRASGALQNPSQLDEIFLEHILAGARVRRLITPVRLVVFGDDYDAGFRESSLDLTGGADSIELRHLDVHQNPIRPVCSVSLECLRTVAAFKERLREVAEHALYQTAHLIVVFHNE